MRREPTGLWISDDEEIEEMRAARRAWRARIDAVLIALCDVLAFLEAS